MKIDLDGLFESLEEPHVNFPKLITILGGEVIMLSWYLETAPIQSWGSPETRVRI